MGATILFKYGATACIFRLSLLEGINSEDIKFVHITEEMTDQSLHENGVGAHLRKLQKFPDLEICEGESSFHSISTPD